MSAKFLRIPRRVDRNISKFPLYVQNKISFAFEKILKNPISGVKLKGELSEYYKLRVGDYRIVYKFIKKDSTVEIVKVEHRQGVYK